MKKETTHKKNAPECGCKLVHMNVVKKAGKKLANDALILEMSELFKCFADPTRLKIINALLVAEMCVCDISAVLGLSQPSVSHHLQQLRQLRLVKFRRTGKSVYYSLNDYHVQLMFDMCKTHVLEE